MMRTFHRTIGVILALFVIIFALTGMALNHSQDLQLDKQFLSWPWLIKHYDMASVEADSVFLLEQKVISQYGQQVFVDANPVLQESQPILGAVHLGEVMILATEDALILLTTDGDFIERITYESGLPPMIQNIGLFHGEPVIQTKGALWRSDFMLEAWEKLSLQGVSWSVTQPMPDSVSEKITEYFHGQGVSMQRVLHDIHTGDILGKLGHWLVDLLAGLMVILSLSGLWLWLTRLFGNE